MGRARSVTAVALDSLRRFQRDVDDVMRDGKITSIEAARLRRSGRQASADMQFADARSQVARMVLEDVRDARNIEVKCARANISPLVFDFGPEPEAA